MTGSLRSHTKGQRSVHKNQLHNINVCNICWEWWNKRQLHSFPYRDLQHQRAGPIQWDVGEQRWTDSDCSFQTRASLSRPIDPSIRLPLTIAVVYCCCCSFIIHQTPSPSRSHSQTFVTGIILFFFPPSSSPAMHVITTGAYAHICQLPE